MKSVLISIQPKYVGKIASGGKTIEVRKTRPKLETPFKCYIYMSQGKLKDLGTHSDWFHLNRMKVIGEFVCDRIGEVVPHCDIEGFVNQYIHNYNADVGESTCLTFTEMKEYLGNNKGYAWHISKLKIYDTPKELGDFSRHDNSYDNAFGWAFEDKLKRVPLKRPPQSWCYVESKY